MFITHYTSSFNSHLNDVYPDDFKGLCHNPQTSHATTNNSTLLNLGNLEHPCCGSCLFQIFLCSLHLFYDSAHTCKKYNYFLLLMFSLLFYFSLGNLAVISYSIYAGDPQGYFTLNSANAELSVNSPPDHELYPFLILTIQAASGSPPLYGLTQVNITILDVNDNSPQFSSNREVVIVPESMTVGSTIFISTATDRDSGDFGLLRYKLVQNPDNKFSIHRVTGQIILEAEISYNEQSSYEVIVQAYDRGSPSRKANLTLTVLVQDVNDNGPQFSPTTYQMSISEATSISTQFLQVMATDQDEGINARITYSVKPSIDAAYFAIFPDGGWVYTRQHLDYELRSEFILEVIASDNGSPPQNSSAVVRIIITDENDNSPQFQQETYYFYIDENLDANTLTGWVVAEDRDSGRNSQITYTLSDNNAFSINPTTGKIIRKEDLGSNELQ